MGSPYNHCHIELIGFDKMMLPKAGWSDKYAWTDDSKRLVLVKWDFENNIPGFHLYFINTENGEVFESPRIFGLLSDISIAGKKVRITKFLYNKEKSEPGKLCCDVNEEFDFE